MCLEANGRDGDWAEGPRPRMARIPVPCAIWAGAEPQDGLDVERDWQTQ